MRKTIEVTTCDLCKLNKPVTEIKYPVLFHTEQTEGRTVTPYISMQNLDVCEECKPKILMVHGWGAQGYNEYKHVCDCAQAKAKQKLADLLKVDMSGFDEAVHGDYYENLAEYLLANGIIVTGELNASNEVDEPAKKERVFDGYRIVQAETVGEDTEIVRGVNFSAEKTYATWLCVYGCTYAYGRFFDWENQATDDFWERVRKAKNDWYSAEAERAKAFSGVRFKASDHKND